MSIPDEREKIKLSHSFEEISLDEVENYYPPKKSAGARELGTSFLAKNRKDLLIVGIIILVGTGSYGIGRLSSIDKAREPIKILHSDTKATSTPILPKETVKKETSNLNPAGAATAIKQIQPGMLVGAKSGNKYHYPWCSGAQRIKEENKIWFTSSEEARKAGYTPAANCKGLQ